LAKAIREILPVLSSSSFVVPDAIRFLAAPFKLCVAAKFMD
jgi:hypothetical protein